MLVARLFVSGDLRLYLLGGVERGNGRGKLNQNPVSHCFNNPTVLCCDRWVDDFFTNLEKAVKQGVSERATRRENPTTSAATTVVVRRSRLIMAFVSGSAVGLFIALRFRGMSLDLGRFDVGDDRQLLCHTIPHGQPPAL